VERVRGGKLVGPDMRITIADAIELGDTDQQVRAAIKSGALPAYKDESKTSAAFTFWLSAYLAWRESQRVQVQSRSLEFNSKER
jgi:hypothetical protein